MKVVIVGAGIAGLSAGIFALQSGFDARIYEAHTIPGGNATGWKRSGYYFEAGMHWLVGTGETTRLNKLWHEVGGLQDNNPVYNRDPFLTYVKGKEKIALFRDTNKLKEHLLSVSPQDGKAICQLIKDICSLKMTPMPITDLKGVKVKQKASIPLSQLFEYLKAGKTMARLSKMTIDDYVIRFQHDGIRELLGSVISMKEYSAVALLTTLGGLAAADSGYPKGGSVQLAQNMANTFKRLGGVIEYRKKVDRVDVDGAKANGVWIDGVLHKADAVVVTSDTLTAMSHLFAQPLREKWLDELRAEIKPVNCTFLSLGVSIDMSYLPENMVFSLKIPFIHQGKSHQSIFLNNYATFEGYAPKGCTALTTVLFEETYDMWKQSYEDGSYQARKQELAEAIIGLLERELPETKGKVEVWDVATPLTYERYCGTYRGSWMSVMEPNIKKQIYQCNSESIKNLYFSGQRLMIPGGMPAAMMTSRTAVQQLCKDTNFVFQGKM